LASISTTAAAPSESCEALPAVMKLPGPLTGSSLARPSSRGVGAIALVAIDHVVDDAFFLRLLVDHLHLGLHRDDLVLELAGLLGGRHAALRFQRILVLVFAADLVALGDDVGGVDHRHVDRRRDLQQLGIVVFARAAAAGEADRLHAAGHDHVGAVIDDVARGHGDRLQARGAEAVDGDAAGGDRQAGQQRGVAAQVLGAVGDVAHEAVLDRFLLDAGLGDGVLHRVRRHADGGGDIEPAAA
jgi:hypothetical protein